MKLYNLHTMTTPFLRWSLLISRYPLPVLASCQQGGGGLRQQEHLERRHPSPYARDMVSGPPLRHMMLARSKGKALDKRDLGMIPNRSTLLHNDSKSPIERNSSTAHTTSCCQDKWSVVFVLYLFKRILQKQMDAHHGSLLHK